MTIRQRSCAAGSDPSWVSVAEPLNAMVSPTLKVRSGLGEAMVAVGDVLVAAAVVKVHDLSCASAAPPALLTPVGPPLTVATYVALTASVLVGSSVATFAFAS